MAINTQRKIIDAHASFFWKTFILTFWLLKPKILLKGQKGYSKLFGLNKRFGFFYSNPFCFLSAAPSTKVIVAIIFRNCQNEFRSIIFIDKKMFNIERLWMAELLQSTFD